MSAETSVSERVVIAERHHSSWSGWLADLARAFFWIVLAVVLWIRILFRCWQDRIAYDENRYLAARAERGSPLSSVLTATATTL